MSFARVLSVALFGCALAAHAATFDLLIRGGTVVDGSGAPGRTADIGIQQDRIAFIGDAAREGHEGRRVLQAGGLAVAPGFIDPHTHAFRDLVNAGGNANLPYLLQGITTVFIGNDGIVLESDGNELGRIGPTLARLESMGVGTNVAMLLGHNIVRSRVLGFANRAPTAAELDAMKQLVDEGMREGAFGFSTGLTYTPGVFSETAELVELSKVAAARGGLYDSHIRDEGNFRVGLIPSVQEVLRIGREAKIPVHISHIKALGVDVWGKSAEVIALMKAARAEGVDATASQYPYTASATHIIPGLFPGWAREGGNDKLLERMKDPATRQRIAADIDKNLAQRNGPAAQTINGPRNPAYAGKNLEAIAKELGVAPAEAAMRIVEDGGAGIISYNMSDRDLDAFMVQDFVVGGSDGGAGHPRRAGTFARRIGEYVTRRKLLTLPQAVHMASARTAEIFGVKERGLLKTGNFADIVVFDPATYADGATYAQPDLPPTGVRWVVVNGRVAVEDGRHVPGVLAGRSLRKN
ncbi:N-acyl-D-amino-acid deacylase family protein [Ramlibacter albus]|uniref:D-aminoacylase n=1 Tax=Ramlibacter albus TaxID=2079448 RepID=A0A923MBP3_9BURK|nr:D-aminoacylase [Ramlibacter albus]MBC5766379.1 D-aminoacylase [Ramlibacter albus]